MRRHEKYDCSNAGQSSISANPRATVHSSQKGRPSRTRPFPEADRGGGLVSLQAPRGRTWRSACFFVALPNTQYVIGTGDDFRTFGHMLEAWELPVPCLQAAQVSNLGTVLCTEVFT
jgi:hypothetical protein